LIDYSDPRGKTWFLIFLGIACFLAGANIAEHIANPETVVRQNWKERLPKAAVVATIVGACAAVYFFLRALGDIPFDFIHLQNYYMKIHDEFGATSGTAFYMLNVLAFPMNVASISISENKLVKIRHYVLAGLNVLMLLASFQKVGLARSLAITIIMLAAIGKINKWKVALFVLGFLAFFVAHTVFRSPYYGLDYKYYQESGTIRIPEKLAWMSGPYLNLTSGISALDYHLESSKLSEPDYGKNSFYFIMNVLNKIDEDYKLPQHHKRFVYVPVRTNVYTIMRSVYDDFSWFGVIGMLALYGFACKIVFINVMSGRMEWVMVYGILCFASIMSFFSNHFAYIATWVIALWGLLIGFYVFGSLRWRASD
jgi:oligosaccharide repeat unit polymerase